MVALVALAVRVVLLLGPHREIDGDEAIVGLMALNIPRELPAFFWEQHYLGSLEAFGAAASFAMFGPSAWSLKLVPALSSSIFAALLFETARRAFGTGPALVAALYVAIPPSFLGVWSVKARGGYAELLALGQLLILLSQMLVARADAPRALPALAGLAAGLALWTHPIAVVYLVACALYAWVALRDRSAQGRLIPMAVMAAPGFVLGLAPAVAYNVAEGFPSARYVLAGGTAPGSALLNLWGLARYGAPVLAGLAEGTASKELLDADWPGRPGSVAATTALLWLAAALVLWSHRGALTPHKAPPSARAAAPFLLVLLLIPPLVAVSRFAELWAEPRYALPAYAAVPLLGASIWRLANRSRALPFLALAALLAANVGSLLTTRPALALPTSAGSSDAANRAVLIDYLESHGLTRIYTDYWIGYPLAFESREAIIPAIRSGGFDRRDAYAHQVWVEPDPAFVFPRDALGDREFRQDLAAAGGTADVAEVSVYRVYTRVRPLDVLRP